VALGDDLAAALPGLQAEAESMMRTPCTVHRASTVTTGPRGEDVEVPGDLVYEGGCELKSEQVQVLTEESASSTVTVQRLTVKLPVSSGPYRVGDVVEVGARRLRITGLHRQTFQTAQRLPVEELVQ